MAQCDTIRLKLFEIGARIKILVRKIWLAYAEGYPHADIFRQVYENLRRATVTT